MMTLTGAAAQLRHAYAQLAAGKVVDQQAFADGLIAPIIRCIEREAHQESIRTHREDMGR